MTRTTLLNVIALLLAASLFVPPAFSGAPAVMVSDYTITPPVLQPGDVGTITAILRNTASSASIQQSSGIQSGGTFESTTSTDISVTIESVQLESKDVEVISGNYKRVGAIGPGQSIPITFLIRAPAQDGIYFPEIWIDVKDGQSVRQPVPVNVNTRIAVLKKPALTAFKTVPEGISPGEEIAAQVTLRNDGLSRADEVTVSINCSSPSVTQKTPSTFHLGSLQAGENRSVGMVFATDKTTPIGINRVCLAISFTNPDGTTTTQDEVIGIHVRGRADIGIASLTTDPVRIAKGDPVSLVIRLENTGTDNANSVRAGIDLPLAGSHDAFVGTIEPKSDAPAVFALQAGDPGTYTYNLTVRFEDDYGAHVQQETLRMTVMDSGNGGLIIGVLAACILLAGAGYWYFVLRRKDADDV